MKKIAASILAIILFVGFLTLIGVNHIAILILTIGFLIISIKYS